MPSLIIPTIRVRESFIEAAVGLRDEGWTPGFPVDEVAADFDAYVRRVVDAKVAWGVPTSTLWYVDDSAYLGTVIIRHQLTPALTTRGGHIGYHVAPRYRGRGHATAMLGEALAYCRDRLGLRRVLLTCSDVNVASQRVIEANGGMLENTVDGERRYWISSDDS
jgi:predicted acetyltransferase